MLSLAGIVINNAIVLIDRIGIEQEAGLNVHNTIVSASITRLRPVLMNTITPVLGLLLLIVRRDILFYELAVVVSGGLLVGTLLIVMVVPALYRIMCRDETELADPNEPEPPAQPAGA